MATVDLATQAFGGTHQSLGGATFPIYYVERTLNFATAATTKGSALAAADVIEIIDVPAESVIFSAGFEVITAAGGESADNAWDLGVTGIDADVFVDGFDGDAAVAGDYAQQPAAYQPVVIGGTADTIDLLIQAATTAPTSGVLRVWAWIGDVKGKNMPGRAALGS